MWWVKDAPVSAPLVATLAGNGTNGNNKAVIGEPGTTILYGNGVQPFPTFSGLRATAGIWLDDDGTFGIESSGFILGQRTAGYRYSGDSSGNPNLDIPIYNSVGFNGGPNDKTAGENAFPFSQPSEIVGSTNITSSLRLWGADLSGLVALYRGSSWQLYAVTGFRYLDLFETFSMQTSLTGIGSFSGERGTVSDYFQSRNQFYGGTAGLRTHYQFGAFSLDVTGKLAMGTSHEVLNVRGSYIDSGFNQPASGNQGIFAQPSNSGNFVANDFAVVPEVILKVAYDVRPWWRISVGYDYLYYSSVVRPADQLSHSLPKSQIFSEGGTAISATSPVPQFNKSDFYAQGVSFGMTIRY